MYYLYSVEKETCFGIFLTHYGAGGLTNPMPSKSTNSFSNNEIFYLFER
jgi:hypothetical protein